MSLEFDAFAICSFSRSCYMTKHHILLSCYEGGDDFEVNRVEIHMREGVFSFLLSDFFFFFKKKGKIHFTKY